MMEAKPQVKKGWNWLFGYQAVVYAAGLLAATGLVTAWGQWYSIRHTHRRQAEALLDGRLTLSSDLADIEFSHTWSGGGVQQVWGLGVALWQLPFEAVARAFGSGGFPDRIAFGLFAALVCFVVLRTWVLAWADELVSEGSVVGSRAGVRTLTVGLLGGVGVLLLSAPFVTLLQTRRLPLEETVAYAYLFGLLLMALVLGFIRAPTAARWLLLCAVAGLGGLLRPTLLSYGVASLLVGGWFWLKPHSGRWTDLLRGGAVQWPREVWTFGAGLVLFCAGTGLLWWTNLVRFGDGFEFGHRLNVQPTPGTMYATRFSHPFESEPLSTAGRELFGALFLVGELNGMDWYRKGFFPGQSPAPRWREFYFRTYDWTYVPLMLLGWGAAVARGFGRRISTARDLVLGLGAWSMLATVPLLVFYLYVPVMSSRYMMDFAPAFEVAVALGWTVLALRGKRWWSRGLMCLLLCGWVGIELALGRGVLAGGGSTTWAELKAVRDLRKTAVEHGPLSGRTLGETRSGIPFDGTGWDEKSGELRPLVVLFVTSPEFLELDLETRPHQHIPARPQDIRAKMGLEALERAQIIETEKGWRVLFNGPRKPLYRMGIQTAFVATVPHEYLAEPTTPWVLRSVRWRDAASVSGLNSDRRTSEVEAGGGHE